MNQHDESASGASDDASGPVLRKPTAADGTAVWDLIAACPPLDQNSVYCNLLQCTDFADTSIIAELDGELVGWISGYRPPKEPRTLFVWQVAVHRNGRGRGLAGKMLTGLLERPECDGVTTMKTTITPDNEGSFALFRSFAKRMGAPFNESDGFDKRAHFDGRHDSERLITIGPIPRASDGNDADKRSAA